MPDNTISPQDLNDKELHNLVNQLANERGLSALEVELLHRWRREVEFREAKEAMAQELMSLINGSMEEEKKTKH